MLQVACSFLFLLPCSYQSGEAKAGAQADDARVGTKTLAAWLEEWRGADAKAREEMAGFSGPDSALNPAAVDHCLERLKSADALEREAICALLRREIGNAINHPETGEFKRVLAALAPLLEDHEPAVRMGAATTLLLFDWHVKPAMDAMLAFARDSDPVVRLKATRQLIGCARVEPRVIELMIEHAASPDVDLRRAAVYGLAGARDEDERALEHVRDALEDSDEQIRVTAARRLAYAGQASDEVVAVLLALCASSSASIRSNAANALDQVGKERAGDVIPKLIELLHDPDADVCGMAIQSLGNLGLEGADASEAGPRLAELARSENGFVRQMVAFALGHVGADAEVAVPALAGLLSDPDGETRGYVLDSLKQAGPEIVRGLPQLIVALKDPQPGMRQRVAELIAMGGAAAKDAVDALVLRLGDPILGVRVWSAYALRQIGPDAAAATPRLMKSLAEDAEPKMRVEAARTLAGIGPLAGAAADALVAATKDPETEVRLWSLFALGEIAVTSDATLGALRATAASADAAVAAEANKALAKLGEEHDAAAIAKEPAPPATLPWISSPLIYSEQALVLSDANGAAVIVLFDPSQSKEGDAQRSAVHYRFRFLAKGQADATSGEGEVHLLSRQVQPGSFQVDLTASDLRLGAGSLRVQWSDRSANSCNLEWRPEQVRVEYTDPVLFETLDLHRFIR